MNKINYVGQELEIFEKAVNWKRYFASEIWGHLTGDVLEVGAGIGACCRAKSEVDGRAGRSP